MLGAESSVLRRVNLPLAFRLCASPGEWTDMKIYDADKTLSVKRPPPGADARRFAAVVVAADDESPLDAVIFLPVFNEEPNLPLLHAKLDEAPSGARADGGNYLR
ncbi:MAG: hypothetical protein WKF84_14470 [Pyrinomonadaceae bacterium]